MSHTQYRFPQAYDIKQHPLQYFCKHSVYQYAQSTYSVHTCLYEYILLQMQPTLHFQSGTITLVTLTSLLPTLVRRSAGRIFPIRSLLDCQAAQARLAKSKLPQPRVNLIDVAAMPAILRSCVCTTCRETWILVLAVLGGIVGVALQSRKQGIMIRGILPTMFLGDGCMLVLPHVIRKTQVDTDLNSQNNQHNMHNYHNTYNQYKYQNTYNYP